MSGSALPLSTMPSLLASTGGSGSWGMAQPVNAAGQPVAAPAASTYPAPVATASYTPPVYQPTPPHVDVNAVIAAMNGSPAAAAAPTADQSPLASLYSNGGELNGMGGQGNGSMPTMGGFRDFIGSIPGAARDFVGAVGTAAGLNGPDMDAVNAGLDRGSAGDATAEARGFAAGGIVQPQDLQAPTPAPDDGLVPMKVGEGVLTPAATRAVGANTINRLNRGAPDAKKTAAEIAERLDKRRTGPGSHAR